MPAIIRNGITYGGSGTITALDNYSTKEQVVGTWIDGKPLYQKTITVTSITPSSSGLYSIECDLGDINDVFFAEGGTNLYKDSDPYIRYMIPYVHFDTNNLIGLFFNMSTSTIEVRASANQRVALSGYITIRYTKTTD